jgi:hypothetical protein
MATKKISELSAAATLAGTEVVPIVQSNATVKATCVAIANMASALGAHTSGTITPTVDDGSALGSTSLRWADVFLASGGVVNWASGDVTITHSTNTLAFAGASSGYTFDAAISIGGTQVATSRRTGWGAPTGTATRTTFATYAGQNVSSSFVEAEVQAIDDHVKILSERLKGLIDDLTTHGLIGA